MSAPADRPGPGPPLLFLLGAVLLGLSGCADDPVPADLAVVGATVIPMTGERVLPRQTVLVEGDRIVQVGPADEVAVLRGAEVVDGTGLYVLPGLADMHVHLNWDQEDLPRFVENGVTTVRNMYGFRALPAIVEEILAGDRLGPTVYSTSPQIDGPEGFGPEKEFIDRPEDADALVRRMVEAGWPALKLYQYLGSDVFDALVAAARKYEVPYGGHTPTAVGIERVLASRYRFLEHLSGYETVVGTGSGEGYRKWSAVDASRIPALVEATLAAGTWNCPTSYLYVELSKGQVPEADREAIIANRRRFVKALFDAGCPLLAGTDTGGGDFVPAGWGLVEEIRELANAGLTPYQALRTATADAGRFLDGSFGTVERGKRADLLLVGGNPLQDLNALHDVRGVVLRGTWRKRFLPDAASPSPQGPRIHSLETSIRP